MKKVSLILSIMLLTASGIGGSSSVSETQQKETTVIICTGQYSKRYHNSMCRGMKACKGETKKVPLSKAKEMELTPCGHCYK